MLINTNREQIRDFSGVTITVGLTQVPHEFIFVDLFYSVERFILYQMYSKCFKW